MRRNVVKGANPFQRPAFASVNMPVERALEEFRLFEGSFSLPSTRLFSTSNFCSKLKRSNNAGFAAGSR